MKLDHHYSSKYAIGDLVKLENGSLDTILKITFEMIQNVPTPLYILKKEYDDGYMSGVVESAIKCRMIEDKP